MAAPSSKQSSCLPGAACRSACSALPWSTDAASKQYREPRHAGADANAASLRRARQSPLASGDRQPRLGHRARSSLKAEGEMFLVADTEPISVADLVTACAKGLAAPHLLRVPTGAVKRLMATFGKERVGAAVGEFRHRRREAPRDRLGPRIKTYDGIAAMMRAPKAPSANAQTSSCPALCRASTNFIVQKGTWMAGTARP